MDLDIIISQGKKTKLYDRQCRTSSETLAVCSVMEMDSWFCVTAKCKSEEFNFYVVIKNGNNNGKRQFN